MPCLQVRTRSPRSGATLPPSGGPTSGECDLFAVVCACVLPASLASLKLERLLSTTRCHQLRACACGRSRSSGPNHSRCSTNARHGDAPPLEAACVGASQGAPACAAAEAARAARSLRHGHIYCYRTGCGRGALGATSDAAHLFAPSLSACHVVVARCRRLSMFIDRLSELFSEYSRGVSDRTAVSECCAW